MYKIFTSFENIQKINKTTIYENARDSSFVCERDDYGVRYSVFILIASDSLIAIFRLEQRLGKF